MHNITLWQNSSTTSDFGTVRLRAASVAMQREQTDAADAAVSKQMLPMSKLEQLLLSKTRTMQKQAAAQRAP